MLKDNDRLHQSIFRTVKPLVLASGSPRRQQLLTSLGIHFAVQPSPLKEPDAQPEEIPADYALRMARMKAEDVAARRPDAVVLGCDTIVVLAGRILGKPADAGDAVDTLCRLSGRSHSVISGCCIIIPDKDPLLFAVDTSVTFARVSREVLQAYVATGEPMDKAGSYAIQGAGGFLVERIDGSSSNVIGLPLKETVDALLTAGAIAAVSHREMQQGG